MSFVSSRPSFQFATVQSSNILRTTENLESGNWVETRLSVLPCPCRPCEQAVTLHNFGLLFFTVAFANSECLYSVTLVESQSVSVFICDCVVFLNIS